jgi:hypothetical protein
MYIYKSFCFNLINSHFFNYFGRSKIKSLPQLIYILFMNCSTKRVDCATLWGSLHWIPASINVHLICKTFYDEDWVYILFVSHNKFLLQLCPTIEKSTKRVEGSDEHLNCDDATTIVTSSENLVWKRRYPSASSLTSSFLQQ